MNPPFLVKLYESIGYDIVTAFWQGLVGRIDWNISLYTYMYTIYIYYMTIYNVRYRYLILMQILGN